MAVTGVQQGPVHLIYVACSPCKLLGPGGTFMWPDKTVRVHLNEVQLLIFPHH